MQHPRFQQEYLSLKARDARGVNQADLERFNTWLSSLPKDSQNFASRCIGRTQSEDDSADVPDENTVLPTVGAVSETQDTSTGRGHKFAKPQSDGSIGKIRFQIEPSSIRGGVVSLMIITQQECPLLGQEPTTTIDAAVYDLHLGKQETNLQEFMNDSNSGASLIQADCAKFNQPSDQQDCKDNLLPWLFDKEGNVVVFQRSLWGYEKPQSIQPISRRSLRTKLKPEYVNRLLLQSGS